MKVTVDFDDLFKDFEKDESTLKQIKNEIHQKAIVHLANRISYSLLNSLGYAFQQNPSSELRHEQVQALAKIIVNKYENKIKEDIKKIIGDSI